MAEVIFKDDMVFVMRQHVATATVSKVGNERGQEEIELYIHAGNNAPIIEFENGTLVIFPWEHLIALARKEASDESYIRYLDKEIEKEKENTNVRD